MNKKKVLIFSIVVLFCAVAFYTYNNILYKEARNIQEEKAVFVTPSNLVSDYIANASNADLKYLNKTIEIRGKVTEVTDSSLVVENKVFCKMNGKVNINLMNKQVSIKGRCIGYDDLFGQVKFDQCGNQ